VDVQLAMQQNNVIRVSHHMICIQTVFVQKLLVQSRIQLMVASVNISNFSIKKYFLGSVSHCAGCSNDATCVYCANNYYLYGNKCYSQCPIGSFIRDYACIGITKFLIVLIS